MIAIYNSYPTQMVIYFVEDRGDEIKKIINVSYSYKDDKTHVNIVADNPKATIPRAMYEEDKNKTVDKLSSDIKKKFIEGLFK